MGKMKESVKEVLAIEDAYTFAEVSKRKAKKIFDDAQLQEKVLSVLQNGGKVFATQEKKEIVCYYIFERVNWEESSKEEGKTKKESYAYKLAETYWATEKQWKDSFENSIRANLKEYIELGMAEVVIWGEDIYVPDKQKKSFNVTGIITGALLGLSFTYSMDNWALGIPMIFMWAMIFNMLFNADETKLVKRGE